MLENPSFLVLLAPNAVYLQTRSFASLNSMRTKARPAPHNHFTPLFALTFPFLAHFSKPNRYEYPSENILKALQTEYDTSLISN